MFETSMIIIGILGAISITLFYFERKEIKSISKQLQELKDVNSNTRLTLTGPNKQMEYLISLINERIENEKLIEVQYENKDRQLRQSIANISHDLRTPLTSIMGYLQLMEDETLQIEQRRQYAEIVKKRAGSLEVLIDGFYELSRIEAHEYQFEPKSINLAAVLCELVASFYNDFTSRQLEPVIQIDENLPPIIADEQAVHRIFNNLIQNILKYGTGHLEINLRQEGDAIISEFINETTQLKEEDVKDLFERFFTADRMRTGQNTGLGLAITKKLVQQMGHQIEATFEEEKLIIRIKWK